MVIRFFILNDGSPLDFYTSHGSDGGAGGTGKAIVLMEQVRVQVLQEALVFFFPADVAFWGR